MNKSDKVSLILRVCLAFSFIYVAISSFISPQNWVGFLPEFLPGNFITENYFLLSFSIFELILGVWLLSNKKIYYASIVSSVVLFGIIIFNLGAMDIIFRDVSLFLASIALFTLVKD